MPGSPQTLSRLSGREFRGILISREPTPPGVVVGLVALSRILILQHTLTQNRLTLTLELLALPAQPPRKTSTHQMPSNSPLILTLMPILFLPPLLLFNLKP